MFWSGCSLEGMMLKLKLQYFGHLMWRVDSLEKTDAGTDWGQEETGTTEDEMAGWRHWLYGRVSEWTPGDGDGQGGLACCNSWGRKESDTTERLNWTELRVSYSPLPFSTFSFLSFFFFPTFSFCLPGVETFQGNKAVRGKKCCAEVPGFNDQGIGSEEKGSVVVACWNTLRKSRWWGWGFCVGQETGWWEEGMDGGGSWSWEIDYIGQIN